jgi:hypothetical protein
MALGAAAGAAAGTLNETLVKHGIHRDDADYYSNRFSEGGVLLSVEANTGSVSPDAVSDILYRNGGHNSHRSRLSTY